MSNTLESVRRVRVQVEPIEVEVDEDGAIAWTSLQTAFPGCSGLYYKGAECKGSVKFDGKKFQPPGGEWDDRTYYVSLGIRCHTPFGSYENASKQFERSVNAVQRMLGSSIFEMPARRSIRSSKGGRSMGAEEGNHTMHRDTEAMTPIPSVPSESVEGIDLEPSIQKIEISHSKAEKSSSGDILSGIQEREGEIRSKSTQNLSPIEQQFIDLARISTGKDALIDGQREELRRANQRVDSLNEKFSSLDAELSGCKERLEIQEKQLQLFREMGVNPTNNNEVTALSTKLLRKDEELSTIEAGNAQRVASLSKEVNELKERNETLTGQLDETRNLANGYKVEAEKLDSDHSSMMAELGNLRQIRDELRIESVEMAVKWRERMESLSKNREDHENLKRAYDQIETQHREIQELLSKLTEENTRLISRNHELDDRVETFEREIDGINGRWKEAVQGKEAQWEQIKCSLEKELETTRKELEDVQTTLSTVARDAATNAQRVSELEHSRDELRRLLDTHEYKHQEPLKRQIRSLSDELTESHERCKQLNSLVTSLTSDARNSQQDVTDFYYGTSRI